MKILRKVVNRKKKIFAFKANLDANTDDVWNIYNLLSIGDHVTGTVSRKLVKVTGTLTSSILKSFTVTLQVLSFQYDGENDSLRIQGKCARENNFLGMGTSQAMDITPPRQITL